MVRRLRLGGRLLRGRLFCCGRDNRRRVSCLTHVIARLGINYASGQRERREDDEISPISNASQWTNHMEIDHFDQRCPICLSRCQFLRRFLCGAAV
jgi:hypothetical protein